MVTWLEDFLRSFKGVVIMVTHDRYFLDRVTNKILEISHGGLYAYEANYSKFLELKAEREEMELASERKRQSVLRMELEWAKRGCRARSTKQRARLERLEALKNGKAPVRDANVELDSVETRMGKKTIELHHISKSFGEKKILDDFNYIVLRNQRLGIIGPNGCGKSTLIKIIDGMVQPDAGEVEIGRNHPHRVFCTGSAGYGYQSACDRLYPRRGRVYSDQRREDFRNNDAGEVSL